MFKAVQFSAVIMNSFTYINSESLDSSHAGVKVDRTDPEPRSRTFQTGSVIHTKVNVPAFSDSVMIGQSQHS